MRKIIVAPTIQIAVYHIGKDCRNAITRLEQIRRLSRDINDYEFVDGYKYDYPPLTSEYYVLRSYI